MYGVDVPGYTTIIVAVIGMGGFQAALLGMIGEYVGRIYHETKRRPHYLVQEVEPHPDLNRTIHPPPPIGDSQLPDSSHPGAG